VEWTFIYLMFVLKIPIIAAIAIIWWAVKAEPDPLEGRDDGGSKLRPRPHPSRPLPRGPRRGPHGDPATPSPPRVRTSTARARSLER
jgi:hypothetical protein